MKAEEIKEIRHKLHITQKGLAELIGICERNVNMWENNKSKPSKLAIAKMKSLGLLEKIGGL